MTRRILKCVITTKRCVQSALRLLGQHDGALQLDDALYTMCVNTEAPREDWIDEDDRATQVDEFRLVDLNLLFVCMAYELGMRGVFFGLIYSELSTYL